MRSSSHPSPGSVAPRPPREFLRVPERRLHLPRCLVSGVTSFSGVSGEVARPTSRTPTADTRARDRRRSARLGYEISRRAVRRSIAPGGDRGWLVPHPLAPSFSRERASERASVYFERIFKETRKGGRTRRRHDYRLNEHYLLAHPFLLHALLLLSHGISVSSYFLCGFTAAYCLPRYHIYRDLSAALSRLRFHSSFAPSPPSELPRLCIFTITIFLNFSPDPLNKHRIKIGPSI